MGSSMQVAVNPSSMTRVAVGSTNPVKVAATERVVTALLGRNAGNANEVAVQGLAVGSGVSEQPVGESETVAGAENRAARALEADGDADYGVGIEGGVGDVSDRPGLYLIMWAAATDSDRLERAAGPAIRLPTGVTARVRDGEELGPVLDDLLGADDVGERVGAAGVLTGDVVDRESSLVHAVAGAIGPFATDLYE